MLRLFVNAKSKFLSSVKNKAVLLYMGSIAETTERNQGAELVQESEVSDMGSVYRN